MKGGGACGSLSRRPPCRPSPARATPQAGTRPRGWCREGVGYQQGDRIIFLDLHEADPGADRILEALTSEGVHLMSILQFDTAQGARQSSVLVTAENGRAFGGFLNALMASGSRNR